VVSLESTHLSHPGRLVDHARLGQPSAVPVEDPYLLGLAPRYQVLPFDVRALDDLVGGLRGELAGLEPGGVLAEAVVIALGDGHQWQQQGNQQAHGSGEIQMERKWRLSDGWRRKGCSNIKWPSLRSGAHP